MLAAWASLFVATNASAMIAEDKIRAEIEASQARKAARTPIEQKIDSVLLDYLHEGSQKVPLSPEHNARSTLDVKDGDKVEVRIRGSITPALLDEVTRLHGTVHATNPESHILSALVPLDAIKPLAAHADVMAIERAQKGENNWLGNQQGLVAHAVANPQKHFDVRKKFKVDGSGVKVCVLSDSVRYLGQAKDDFTLGDVTVLPGQDGVRLDGRDHGEGTAMLEIIHSIAPGAELMFATAQDDVQMTENIRALGRKGCNIIVDDLQLSGRVSVSRRRYQQGRERRSCQKHPLRHLGRELRKHRCSLIKGVGRPF